MGEEDGRSDVLRGDLGEAMQIYQSLDQMIQSSKIYRPRSR